MHLHFIQLKREGLKGWAERVRSEELRARSRNNNRRLFSIGTFLKSKVLFSFASRLLTCNEVKNLKAYLKYNFSY